MNNNYGFPDRQPDNSWPPPGAARQSLQNRPSGYFMIVVEPQGRLRVEPLPAGRVTIGRAGGGSALQLDSMIVSRQHGEFVSGDGRLAYIDYGENMNGTYHNGRMIHTKGQNVQVAIEEGDILRIDSNDLNAPHENGVIIILTSMDVTHEEWVTIPVGSLGSEVIIGREDAPGRIVVPRINVSRRHARITRGGNGALFVEDLGSLNHTMLNGVMLVGRMPFKERDVINICSTRIIYTSGLFIYNVPSRGGVQPGAAPRVGSVYYPPAPPAPPTPPVGGMPRPGQPPMQLGRPPRPGVSFAPQQGNTIALRGIKRVVNDPSAPDGRKCILDLSQNEVTIRPGELVAIIGGSGAGKTTLVNCMNAFEPASQGDVLINGVSLYQNREAFRLQIGYVPQQDIVHDLLTVKEMLTFVARLRLPRELNRIEIDQQVDSTLAAVGLLEHKSTMIKQLSGGQRKRASIAVEMIADPTLFFLDEPTSGLDPEMEQQLTMQLRDYAHNGRKTVIVVTHTLQSIRLFDKIIFLAPTVNGSGGRLAFFGGCEEALSFFEVSDIVEAYKLITKNPKMYADKFLAFQQRRRAF